MDEELHQLIRQAKRGNKEAFTELIKMYKDRVYRHAYGMLGDRMDAEDAAQEAFIKVYTSFFHLENEYAFSTWLTRIVSNLCLDRLKKRAKDREQTRESMEEATDLASEDKNLRLGIEESMNQLSMEHREVILLHDVQGYKYEEIAQIVGIPIGTVKSRLNVARLTLRKEMRKGDE